MESYLRFSEWKKTFNPTNLPLAVGAQAEYDKIANFMQYKVKTFYSQFWHDPSYDPLYYRRDPRLFPKETPVWYSLTHDEVAEEHQTIVNFQKQLFFAKEMDYGSGKIVTCTPYFLYQQIIRNSVRRQEQLYENKAKIISKYYSSDLELNQRVLQEYADDLSKPFAIAKKNAPHLFDEKKEHALSTVGDIQKNIKESKKQARYKCLYNFHDEKRLSWLTLTLPHHHQDGSYASEVRDLDQVRPALKKFCNKLRYEYKKQMQEKGYSSDKIERRLKTFKYFIAFQTQKKEVWHFHILFNIDLLKTFGATSQILCSSSNAEFLDSSNNLEHKDSSWEIKTGFVIPKVFKMYADIIQTTFPFLKKLNPRAQNLQLFYPQNNKTIKVEIYEGKRKQSVLKKNSAIIIADYVGKYVSNLTDEEINKSIKNKNKNIGRRLFQFSLNSKNLSIKKTFKLFPSDLKIEGYVLKNKKSVSILSFSKDSYFFSILKKICTDKFNFSIEASVSDKNFDVLSSFFGLSSLFVHVLFYEKSNKFNHPPNKKLLKNLTEMFGDYPT